MIHFRFQVVIIQFQFVSIKNQIQLLTFVNRFESFHFNVVHCFQDPDLSGFLTQLTIDKPVNAFLTQNSKFKISSKRFSPNNLFILTLREQNTEIKASIYC